MAGTPQANFNLIEAAIADYLPWTPTPSLAQLRWFLESVWRLEPEDAEEAVCDGKGDRGIDGLIVDPEAEEIVVFQSKHRESAGQQEGRAGLDKLLAVGALLSSPEAVRQVRDDPHTSPGLQMLIDRLKVAELLDDPDTSYTLKLVYICNASFGDDAMGVATNPGAATANLTCWTLDELAVVAQRTRSPGLIGGSHSLPVASEVIVDELVPGTRLAIGLVRATDLLDLPEIDTGTLFDLNVRLSAGNTKPNRALRRAIENEAEHPLFPAFHNGLVLLTDTFQVKGRAIVLEGVAVVNGCQSIDTLYKNSALLTDELRLPVKIVEVSGHPALADQITYRSNNQNGINERDLRGTHRAQLELKRTVREQFPEYSYLARRGEVPEAGTEGIDNSRIAQLLMAIRNERPWDGVRRNVLFGDQYSTVFSHGVSAAHVVLMHLIDKAVREAATGMDSMLRSAYAAASLTACYLVGQMLRLSENGAALLDDPRELLQTRHDDVLAALVGIAGDAIEELNHYTRQAIAQAEDEDRYFDPKVAFKNRTHIEGAARDLRAYVRAAQRKDPDYPLSLPSPHSEG